MNRRTSRRLARKILCGQLGALCVSAVNSKGINRRGAGDAEKYAEFMA